MKRLTQTLSMALVLFALTAFKSEIQNKTTLLVLTDINNENSFSKFKILEKDGILIGNNDDQDYPVKEGVYRIHGSSNNKYYNHNILVVK